jgi:diguanylate cyclase (GGDEF)-like protein
MEVLSGRRWSLRREWSRAWAIMLALLLVAALSTIVGVGLLVHEVQGTARTLNRESLTIASLRTNLVDHEQTAHKLLGAEPVDRAAFVRQQDDIVAEFAQARKVFPTTEQLRPDLDRAEASWESGLKAYHLWGAQALALTGDHSADNPTFGAASDAADGLLEGLESPSLDVMDKGLDHGIALEQFLIVGLATLFGLAFVTTAYFRRRMSRDLVRPVASLLEGVLSLHDGDYDHRIEVARRDELGELAAAFNDMASALHQSHQALTQRASNDPLTGLPNRTALGERIAAGFGPGTARRARHETLLFIDIDDFKYVNDSLGHAGGDAVLCQLAARLTECVRPYDLVARLGGDEFALVVVDDEGGGAGSAVAERILQAMRSPFLVNGVRLSVAVSIGVAQRRVETQDAADLLRDADFAMYMAKGAGKSRYQLFDPRMHDDMLGHSALKADLAVAAGAGQLRLDYQPIADLTTGAILGVEALVRWQHPVRGLLGPKQFITLAEQTGDIPAIGGWVLATALRDVAGWRARTPELADLWLAINLSGTGLADPSTIDTIEAVLAAGSVPTDKLVFEVKETALAADLEGAISCLGRLRALGVRIAVDDFGTGFSSLSTLARLPVDLLKIDRTFVSGRSTPSASVPSKPMLEGILGLADKLSLPVIAEGIEDDEQLDLLRALGCPLGQGFLLAQPAPAQETEALLASGVALRLTQPTG